MSESAEQKRKREQRERTAKHRAKVKEQAANNDAADELHRRDDFDLWRRAQRLVTPGEIEAFVNAESVVDAVQVAREFLISLNLVDVQANESLLDVERRVISAWCQAAGAPLLNRNTLQLVTETGSTIDGFVLDFDSQWIALPGADAVIDISTLPIIDIPTVEVPAVDTPAITDHTNDPAFRNHRSEEVIAICKAQQERCDTEARKISAANLERETLREKRLGVGYAYDVAE